MALRAWVQSAVAFVIGAAPLAAQDTAAVREVHDSVSVRFVDTDLRAAIQALGVYLPKPVIVGSIQSARVSLQTPAPVSRPMVTTLLRGLVESQGLELHEDSAYFEIRSRPPALPVVGPATGAAQGASAPVQLFVIRLRHARASDVAA